MIASARPETSRFLAPAQPHPSRHGPLEAPRGASPASPTGPGAINAGRDTELFVILSTAGQLGGLPVRGVRQVLKPQDITPIPLAPPEIVGSLNLRGRVVTAVDLHRRLGLPSTGRPSAKMSIVVEHAGAIYALLVDDVTEVLALRAAAIESIPPTFPPLLRRFGVGIHRLGEGLVVILDLPRILNFSPSEG